MSHREHRAQAPGHVRCYVLTVSDTRTEKNDSGGRAIIELLTAAGHEVVDREIVKDEPDQVRSVVTAQLMQKQIQAIITTGGTGISSRDRSYEAVTDLLEKRLDGFGELFRALSFQEIGPAAMLSRAFAGTARGKILIALPGSEHAVRLALTKLVLPELGHLVREASR
ncbi:MAG: MogA/MoaB family molybdenum cofactor biosynthesis protein [Acidobacteriota bacterium]|jgi:molybdenum cofactor biosynthesis protein B|nr:molybdenum cofactor biosynthesis protein [Acidobacteriota bacterium]MEC7769363.1 MogA/MoaB family molybdenum cofactor biosynthesis protein [Acidobacteriota bacterium]